MGVHVRVHLLQQYPHHVLFVLGHEVFELDRVADVEALGVVVEGAVGGGGVLQVLGEIGLGGELVTVLEVVEELPLADPFVGRGQVGPLEMVEGRIADFVLDPAPVGQDPLHVQVLRVEDEDPAVFGQPTLPVVLLHTLRRVLVVYHFAHGGSQFSLDFLHVVLPMLPDDRGRVEVRRTVVSAFLPDLRLADGGDGFKLVDCLGFFLHQSAREALELPLFDDGAIVLFGELEGRFEKAPDGLGGDVLSIDFSLHPSFEGFLVNCCFVLVEMETFVFAGRCML